MAEYQVEIPDRVEKQLQALPQKSQQQIRPEIAALAQDPRPSGVKKLKGYEGLYRIRVGSYRVSYEIQDKKLLVLLVKVAHRKDAYR